MKQNLFKLLVLASLLPQFAMAQEGTPSIQNLSLININVNQPSVVVEVSYPRLYDAADCLVAVSEGNAFFWYLSLSDLAKVIVVEEGFGVIGNDNAKMTTLAPEVSDGAVLRYQFSEKNVYITAIRFRTVDGSNLHDALEKILRDGNTAPLPGFIGFQRTSLCAPQK